MQVSQDEEKFVIQNSESIVIDIPNIKYLQNSNNSDDKLIRLQSKLRCTSQNAENVHTLKFYFDEGRVNEKNIFGSLANLEKLEVIKIQCLNDIEWQLHNPFALISKQLNLKYLQFEVFNNNDEEHLLQGIYCLSQSISKIKYLYKIQFTVLEAHDNHLQHLSKVIQLCKHLTELSIKFTSSESAIQGFDYLAQCIRSINQQLTTLELQFEEYQDIPQKETQELLDSIQMNTSIQNLTFSISGCQNFYKEFPQQLSLTLKKMQKLHKLTLGLGQLQLKPAQFKCLLESINSLQNLYSLELDLNSTSVRAEIIANLLKQQTQLTQLNLNLGDVIVKNQFQIISQQLKELTGLKDLTLKLNSTEIGNQKKGCEQLFDFLLNLQLINLNLDLRNEEFSKKFLILICQQIGKISTLEILTLQLGCYDQEVDISNEMLNGILNCKQLKYLSICDALGLTWTNQQFYTKLIYLVDLSMTYG